MKVLYLISVLIQCSILYCSKPLLSKHPSHLTRSASTPGRLRMEIPVPVEVVTQHRVAHVPPAHDIDDDSSSDTTLPISPHLDEFYERRELIKQTDNVIPLLTLYEHNIVHHPQKVEAELADQIENVIKQINRCNPNLITDELVGIIGTARCYIHNLRSGYIPDKVIYSARAILPKLQCELGKIKKLPMWHG